MDRARHVSQYNLLQSVAQTAYSCLPRFEARSNPRHTHTAPTTRVSHGHRDERSPTSNASRTANPYSTNVFLRAPRRSDPTSRSPAPSPPGPPRR